MNPDNLTHDHDRKPKPMKFSTVVIWAFSFLLVALLATYIFLKADARKVVPHPPIPKSTSSLARPHADVRTV